MGNDKLKEKRQTMVGLYLLLRDELDDLDEVKCLDRAGDIVRHLASLHDELRDGENKAARYDIRQRALKRLKEHNG